MLANTVKFNYLDFSDELNENCCEAPNIISTEGYYTCTNCGTTFSRIIDLSGIRAHTQEEKKNRQINERVYSRIGPRTLLTSYKDASGNYLRPKNKLKYERLAKINRDLINGYERNLNIALPLLYRLQNQLKFPSFVSSEALKIYLQALKLKLTKGRTILSLLSASVYSAIRLYELPIFLEEIIQDSELSKKDLYRSLKIIYINVFPILDIKLKHIEPELYIDRIQENLNLSMKTRNIALKILKSSKKKQFKLLGKDPKGFTAAALYISSKINRDNGLQKDLCEAALISEGTLRKRINELVKINNITYQLNGASLSYNNSKIISSFIKP